MSEITDEKLWSWVDRGAPELDRHLEEHPADAERVNEIRRMMGEVARGLDDDKARQEVFQAPERIGDYRLGALLGEGGMGVVYRAHQESPKREVALKLIRNVALADENLLERFRREADALARLTHPSIATIYELGETEGGMPFIAMELVHGQELDTFVRERGLKRRKRLEIFRTICEAVHHAHTKGVIHRDLKPGNILVDDDCVPRILDFGLAHMANPGNSHLVTEPGNMLGTLAYMSPEQVRGRELTEETDVYSLGVLLHELLTDSLPYQVDSTSLPEAARLICEVPPARLSSHDRRLKGDLETITSKALEKDPARRYRSAAELEEDVRRYLENEPIRAQKPRTSYRLRKFVGRHKLATMFALVTLVLGSISAYGIFTNNTGLFGGFVAGGFPTVSPFTSVRFRGPVPEVQLDDRWYELISVDGTRAGVFVENAKQVELRSWKKRFSEDMWEVMFRSGHIPGLRVDLVLRDLDTRAIVEKENVWMTADKRTLVRKARQRNLVGRIRPLMHSRYYSGTPTLKIEREDYKVISVGGLAVEPLITYSRANFLKLVDVVSELLTVYDGLTPSSEVVIVLENLEGRRVEVAFPMDSSDLNQPLLPADELDRLWNEVRER